MMRLPSVGSTAGFVSETGCSVLAAGESGETDHEQCENDRLKFHFLPLAVRFCLLYYINVVRGDLSLYG